MALNLTGEPGDVFERLFRKTSPGMAHLAGSGPDGKACKDCAHFRQQRPGALKGYCKAYRVLWPKPKRKIHFDQSNEACRHFAVG